MSIASRNNLLFASAGLLVAFCACSPPSKTTTANGPASAASGKRIRGTIVSVSPSTMMVSTGTGSVKLALAPSLRVLGVVKATSADVKPGVFVGIANVPVAGSMRALDVVIFPESMRGAGEGNYPWDPQGMPSARNAHGSMMTNGTVSSGETHGSMMTNGTVARHTTGAAITISYKGGSQPIVVPPNAPIVRLVPGSSALLLPGAHVFVMTKSNGGRSSIARIMVGERGVVPPM
ncbi:MAG TPA: hypothetical protein VIJ12_08320 [Candidatus Baltobacteraceae bacterium]